MTSARATGTTEVARRLVAQRSAQRRRDWVRLCHCSYDGSYYHILLVTLYWYYILVVLGSSYLYHLPFCFFFSLATILALKFAV